MILAIIILAILGCVAGWIYQGHKAAMRDRRVFDPLPQAPNPEVSQAIRYRQWLHGQQRRDAEFEARWRKAVAANVERRRNSSPMPAFLRRQAD